MHNQARHRVASTCPDLSRQLVRLRRRLDLSDAGVMLVGVQPELSDRVQGDGGWALACARLPQWLSVRPSPTSTGWGGDQQRGTSMTNADSTVGRQDGDQHTAEAAGKPRPSDDHPFRVTVRTLAGHSRREMVKPLETVSKATEDAVKYFVARGELTDGSYALTLPRTGGDAELDPTATLRDAGVVEDDVLVLVSRKPQVDG
jgi:hypothetical protein